MGHRGGWVFGCLMDYGLTLGQQLLHDPARDVARGTRDHHDGLFMLLMVVVCVCDIDPDSAAPVLCVPLHHSTDSSSTSIRYTLERSTD